MIGKITSQQTCDHCGAKGKYRAIGADGLICVCGKSVPTLYEVELYWQRKRVRISHDQTGRRIDGYRHAVRVLEVIRAQIDEGVFDPADWRSSRSNRRLWPNYLDDYLAREKIRLLPERAATFAKKRALAKHLNAAFQCNVKSITSAMVEDYFAKPCLRLALSPKTRADLTGELRFIFRRAVIREDIARAPQVPSVTVSQMPIAWLDAERQAFILSRVPEQHRPIFSFLFMYGCRVAEACALCWDQIDQENEAFFLARTFSRRKLAQTTKTKRVAALPIIDEFQVLLDQAAATYKELGRLPAGESPVLVNPEAHPSKNPEGFYSPDFLNARWQEALKAAGMNYIQLKNATRHSKGTQLLNAGVDLATVARLLTHTNTTHTRKYATHQVQTLKKTLDQAAGKVRSIKRKKDGK